MRTFFLALCCLGHKKLPPPAGNVFQRLVGNDVSPSPYAGSGDRPVSTCDELACTFDSGCCWSNAISPTDQLDFMSLTGSPEPAKMRHSFGTDDMPSGNFLGAGTETGSPSTPQMVQFYSCPVQCAQGTVTVQLR
jgi:hypothetical protein